MKVSGVGQVFEVEIVPAEFGDGAGVGENVAPSGAGQDDGESARGCAIGCGRDHAHAGNIYARMAETIERNLAEVVVGDARLKADSAAQRGEIVGDDGG